MMSLRDTQFYAEVLKEFNYPFADIFVFDGFIISEINEGTVFSWEEHARPITKDISNFTGSNGKDFIYLSHRINSYSVKPMDWLHFYNHNFDIKGYGVIGYDSRSFFNTVIENLFFKKTIKRFKKLEAAILWANGSNAIGNAEVHPIS